MQLAETIKLLQEENKLNDSEFAKSIGISASEISLIKSGKRGGGRTSAIIKIIRKYPKALDLLLGIEEQVK